MRGQHPDTVFEHDLHDGASFRGAGEFPQQDEHLTVAIQGRRIPRRSGTKRSARTDGFEVHPSIFADAPPGRRPSDRGSSYRAAGGPGYERRMALRVECGVEES